MTDRGKKRRQQELRAISEWLRLDGARIRRHSHAATVARHEVGRRRQAIEAALRRRYL
ncbi:MAG: hypothetical protein ACJ761_08075 [Chloroflexota bacterium]